MPLLIGAPPPAPAELRPVSAASNAASAEGSTDASPSAFSSAAPLNQASEA
jgi:hypothetical protein